jgi:hypothetical protein
MKKKIIALSAITALATTSFAASNSQLQELKEQIATLEAKIESNKKKIKKVNKKASKAKMLANKDNLKLNVDFRTSVDKITYKLANGTEATNDNLLTNRLWINMAYAPSSNISFRGRLSYLKAYGAEPNNTQRASGNSAQVSDFDWVTNENAHGDSALNVKQAYWLYVNDTFLGNDVPWTASIGRRPATDGLLANFREDQNRQSALAHTVNVEFDGASFKWSLDKVIPMTGSWVKLCLGRGITNASARFSQNSVDYSKSDTLEHDSNMVGFIFVPYDDGQYSVHTNVAKGTNLIGYASNGTGYLQADGNYGNGTLSPLVFKNFGDMTWMTAAFVADGIGDGINDTLDESKFFISFAQSKSDPNGSYGGMLGSTDEQTGNSTWIGMQLPCPLTDDGRVGVEWNKGSKYWRSMTYGEDTMIGSKVAARGTAVEAYYNKPLTKALSASIRYTKIDYDYTGSNGFFGNASGPMTIADAKAAEQNPVTESSDIRAYIRYRY